MTLLPDKPQPDALPVHPSSETPSLWIYFILIVVSVGLIVYAFSLQDKPDWPGLMLNIAAGFIGAVVVLIVVDRRLRSSEIEAIRTLPRAASFHASAWLSPTGRLAHSYCRSLLVSLDGLLADKLPIPAAAALDSKVLDGFVLLAEAGTGKTTWLQMVARSLAAKTLTGDPAGRVPIVLSLRRWREGQTLEEEIYDLVSSFSRCRRWAMRRLLKSGKAVLLFDGYDELWSRELPLEREVTALKTRYPKLKCSITSRSTHPTPSAQLFGPTHRLPLPTEEEVLEIFSRRKKRYA